MDAAKAAINKLTSGHGHHTTEVHEHYKPAVTHEQINPTLEQQDTTVVDKEIHHDHHHTSVLPVQDKQVLPTEHSHNIAETKHVEHRHGDHEGLKSKIAAEAQQFRDHSETAETQRTHTQAPTVGSEHHHHHVHETIQPIVQKQTIQPSVVHTTIPVHEVHHNEPKHYTASALPAVSLSEFKSQGGSLTGLADRVERFEGEPENIAQKGHSSHGTHSGHGTHHGHGTHSDTTGTGLGSTGTGVSSSTSHGLTDRTNDGTTSSGLGQSGSSGLGSSSYNETGRSGLTGNTGSTGVGSSGYDETSRSGLTGNNTSSGLGHSSGSGLTGSTGTSGLTGSTGSSGLTGSSRTGLEGQTSSAQQNIDSRVDKPGHHGSSTTGTGLTGGSSGLGHSSHSTTTNTTTGSDTTKPSLLSRMNPFKDSDGDGKKGMMD